MLISLLGRRELEFDVFHLSESLAESKARAPWLSERTSARTSWPRSFNLAGTHRWGRLHPSPRGDHCVAQSEQSSAARTARNMMFSPIALHRNAHWFSRNTGRWRDCDTRVSNPAQKSCNTDDAFPSLEWLACANSEHISWQQTECLH